MFYRGTVQLTNGYRFVWSRRGIDGEVSGFIEDRYYYVLPNTDDWYRTDNETTAAKVAAQKIGESVLT